MSIKSTSRVLTILVMLALVLSLFTSTGQAAPTVDVTFTILHTNDFHGQLEPAGSNPGMARTANVINGVRTAVGDANVLVVDAGDEMQGSLLSNLTHGSTTIQTYNAVSYDLATFGNHEFDWGQTNLGDRTTEATYPYITSNIVVNDTGNCATAGWTTPAFADAPWQMFTIGTPETVKVAFIGVTTQETPYITVSTATAGLCFKDPKESILHYYDAMKAAGADVIVVLSHLGFNDGGYGYGIPVLGDKTLASDLIKAGKPVNMIIGGHSHSDLSAATEITVAGYTGKTWVAQAHYNGRKVGRADFTVKPDGSVAVVWTRLTVSTSGTQDATIDALIDGFVADPTYQAIVNEPIGYSAVDLARSNSSDNMMGTFIDDAIYDYLNNDAEPTNDVDLFFNNAGGIRTDWCWNGADWVNTGCVAGVHAAGLLTYGDMFTILPFGNATVVGEMTGAEIFDVVNYGPNVAGIIQPAGLRYTYFEYNDANPGPQPWAWGAYDIEVYNKTTATWEPLDMAKTYKVGTNEFLAPAGGDGYAAFKNMDNISYWGDMLNAVNAYVTANYTLAAPYMGPNGDGTLDGRIIQDTSGTIIPLTILHHNDSHGNAAKTTYPGYTQLVTLIKQERLHNPTCNLLLSSGDNIQGDAMMYYFKTAPTGFTSDGTPIVDPTLHMNPLIKAMNTMNYDAMVLGNHEFNFGKDVFTSVLGQATFPLLQANLTDDGSYGLAAVNIQPYVTKTICGGVDVAILGIGNHRVPNYELPSNIPGLTFSDPIVKTQELLALLRPTNDVVVALTHIGFTENPTSVEVDANVDTNLIATTSGLDALVGGHSHTNPATGFGSYKYLPGNFADADGNPVIVGHAYRYNNTLGELVLGLHDLGGGNYEIVTQTGRYLTVSASGTEDAATKAIIDPYVALLNTYNNTIIGQTTVAIDTLQAYTQETNGANQQADAGVYELESHGIDVDFHLSGAMSNRAVATSGPYPMDLKISDMFSLMPYENSLVVISMNGPQLKAVLERAYRNYYYYKYVPLQGGYSYYTTCMIDTNAGNVITYNDLYPALPNGKNVVSLVIGGVPVDFTDASTYYNVSTVNYLAAGSCNFNDGGVSLWPLDQIVADTQYYVRDAVINYVTHLGTVSPAIEGRLAFISDSTAPVATVAAPLAQWYMNTAPLTIDFGVTDDISGVKKVVAKLDGVNVVDGKVLNLKLYKAGTTHKLVIVSTDNAYNTSTKVVSFKVKTTIAAMKTVVTWMYTRGDITSKVVYDGLINKLNLAASAPTSAMKANWLNLFIHQVNLQIGISIPAARADLLIADVQWLINTLP